MTLSQKKNASAGLQPPDPQKLVPGGGPHPLTRWAHKQTWEKRRILSNLPPFTVILHWIALWTWCPAFRVGVRRSASLQTAVLGRPTARFSRCPSCVQSGVWDVAGGPADGQPAHVGPACSPQSGAGFPGRAGLLVGRVRFISIHFIS